MSRPKSISDAEILETARTVLLREGPQVATSAIAAAVGLSQAALFKRFGTKNGLILAALAPTVPEDWLARLEEGPDERPIPEQLHPILIGFHEVFARIIPAMSVLRDSGVDLRAVIARFDPAPPVRARRALSRWLELARDQGRLQVEEPELVATALLGAMHSRSFMHHTLGEAAQLTEVEPFVSALVAQFWRGLAPSQEA